MPSYVVEFVFDYMVILADVYPDFETDVHENDIIEMAKSNILDAYGINIKQLDITDIIVHERD